MCLKAKESAVTSISSHFLNLKILAMHFDKSFCIPLQNMQRLTRLLLTPARPQVLIPMLVRLLHLKVLAVTFNIQLHQRMDS